MHKVITFKGKRLSRARVKNNILKVYNKADAHTDWYVDAHAFCKGLSIKYNRPLSVVVGIVSALSPLKTWDKNKEIAEYYLQTNSVLKGGKYINFTKQCDKVLQLDRCWLIWNKVTDEGIQYILKGEKTKSFYLNIMHPSQESKVTVDRHAIAVALGRVATDEEQALTPLIMRSSRTATFGQLSFWE